MRYGIPYKGSKSKIAEWVVGNLPSSEHFYDLFAGGCAVTHCAMLSGKYSRYHINDVEHSPQLFVDAATGKYNGESRWISREDFFRLKEQDPYVKFIWSFGNNGINYIYSRDIEESKRQLWEYCFAGNPHERRMGMKGKQRLQSLERLQRLERLQSLERLDAIMITNGSYADVDILPGSTVYCDIPYISDKKGYTARFSHQDFYQWARTRDFPVYVSEYTMPGDFVQIASIPKKSSMCATHQVDTTECIFVHRRFAPRLTT